MNRTYGLLAWVLVLLLIPVWLLYFAWLIIRDSARKS